MNKKKIILIISVILIVTLSITLSYAYFTATTAGNNSANNTAITTGNMEVTFADGDEINAENLIPGDYVEKTFTVTNTGNVPATYDIYFTEVLNTFANKDELVYELISEDGKNIDESVCPEIDSTIANNIQIGVGETHHYKVKLTFKETNLNQDSNKGKEFFTKITIKKLFDVRLVQTKVISGYTNNYMISPVNYSLLSNYANQFNPKVYFKQDATQYVATISTYYTYKEDGLFTESDNPTLEECDQYINNQKLSLGDNVSASCYEKDGNIWFHFEHPGFLTQDECMEYNYNSDDEGNLIKPDSDTYHGECIETKDEPIEEVVDTIINKENTQMCIYNDGDEICVNELLNFDEEPDMQKIMNIYNYMNSKKRFICSFNYGKFGCTTYDDEIIVFANKSIQSLSWTNRYYSFNQKTQVNSFDECFEMTSSSREKCIIDDGNIYYYKTNSSYNSYSTLEECQNYCDNQSGNCYCQKYYEGPSGPGYQWNQCELTETNATCNTQRTM